VVIVVWCCYTGGFLLPNVTDILHLDPEVEEVGTEFYQFPREMIDLGDLEDSGWIDAQTEAVFHDFAIYAPKMDLFSCCRMVVEQDPANGIWTSHMSIRVINLHAFPHER
jgi:hypothetical protein